VADITFTVVEAALVTQLKSAVSAVEDRNIASYAGQIEDANNGLPVEAPALFVMFEEFIADEGSMSVKSHVGEARFTVVVFGDSFVGGTTPRTTASKGAYALIDAVIAALDDASLSISGFQGVTFIGVELISATKIRAIYKVKFTATLEVTR